MIEHTFWWWKKTVSTTRLTLKHVIADRERERDNALIVKKKLRGKTYPPPPIPPPTPCFIPYLPIPPSYHTIIATVRLRRRHVERSSGTAAKRNHRTDEARLVDGVNHGWGEPTGGSILLPSGNLLHNYGTSPFSMEKSTINGHFQ